MNFADVEARRGRQHGRSAIVRRGDDLPDRQDEVAPEGADVVAEPLGGPYLAAGVAHPAPYGLP